MADHYSHMNRSRFPAGIPPVPALASGMNPFPLLQNQQLLNQMLLSQSIPKSHPNPIPAALQNPAAQTTPSSKLIKSPETSPGSDSGISNPGNPARKRIRAASPLDLSARKSPETVSETAKSDFERLAGKIKC